jgi:adenylate cyclase
MAQEIERKFSVISEAWRAAATDSSLLRQGYLSSNAKATVRVRVMDDAAAVLTLKGQVEGITRPEFEYAIPLDDARDLLVMAGPNIVEKRRHLVPHEGLVWEVDEFLGRHSGLVVAEVELTSEDQAVLLPDWVGAEVTQDDRYSNASLSRSPATPGR